MHGAGGGCQDLFALISLCLKLDFGPFTPRHRDTFSMENQQIVNKQSPSQCENKTHKRILIQILYCHAYFQMDQCIGPSLFVHLCSYSLVYIACIKWPSIAEEHLSNVYLLSGR